MIESVCHPINVQDLLTDIALYDKAAARVASHISLHDCNSDEFLQAFRVQEIVKNRWGGMPPITYLEDIRAEIAAIHH